MNAVTLVETVVIPQLQIYGSSSPASKQHSIIVVLAASCGFSETTTDVQMHVKKLK